MIDKDILFTLAELAVALAGFSAIIGVLSSRKDSADLKVNALRLQVMLETCFMVAAAALVPKKHTQPDVNKDQRQYRQLELIYCCGSDSGGRIAERGWHKIGGFLSCCLVLSTDYCGHSIRPICK